jgi:glycosyltransferase involved in cell wall biosynthesis
MQLMEVALVHDFLVRLGGAERVLAALRELFPKAPIYTLLYDAAKVGVFFPQEKIRTSRLQRLPNQVRKRHKFLLPLMPRVVEEWDFSKSDLVISSSSAFSHGVLTPDRTHHLTYFHSPMRYAWDWTHEYIKEQKIGKLQKAAIALLLKKIRIWDQVASSRSDTIVANSKNVQRRIKKYYRRDSLLLYPPVDTDRFKISRNHEDFFLIVSTLTPYKRIDLAIQLFNRIQRRLVIIGEGPQREYLEGISGNSITFLGSKNDATVAEYLRNCRALIFPGEEDFGITPVEAMACGKPVLGFGMGGLRETVIPGITGEFFSEPTVVSMEAGLAKLMEGTYSPTACRKQALKFSKEIFVDGMKKLTRQITSALRG